MKSGLINMTRAWDNKHLSTRQELNPCAPKHRAGAITTELRELLESNKFIIFLALFLQLLNQVLYITELIIHAFALLLKMISFARKSEKGHVAKKPTHLFFFLGFLEFPRLSRIRETIALSHGLCL